MLKIAISSTLSVIADLVILIAIAYVLEYIFIKELRPLFKQIKRVICSRQTNKITQIKAIILKELF